MLSVALGAMVSAGRHDRIDGAATARVVAARLAVPVASPPPVSQSEAAGRALVEMLNAERARRGLSAVSWHGQVAAAASAHSADMAGSRRMSHTGTDGSNAGQRLERTGFVWGSWAENVGAGYPNATAMFDGWMTSAGHRENMLGQFRYVGVAAIEGGGAIYWTLVVAN